MDNDDKRTSPDDETPPGLENESEDAHDYGARDTSREQAEAARKNNGGTNNTISFPKAKSNDQDTRSDEDFGMPDLSFFREESSAPKATGEQSVADALTAARSGLEGPPQEETGWQDTGSIEKPPFLETLADMAKSDAGEDGEAPALGELSHEDFSQSQATVMPFPGSTVQRSTEPEPSELLGGSTESRGVDLFGSDQGEPAEALPDFDPNNKDSIADAVHSALRNVYGGTSANQDDDGPEIGGFTVAESLRQAAAAETGDADEFWADSDQDWRDERQGGYEAPVASGAAAGEADPDTVLDYLYGDRRDRTREQKPLPGEASLRDLGEASGHDRDWPGNLGYGEGDPYRDRGRHFSDRRPGRGYEDEEPDVTEWAQPPFVTSSSGTMPEGQYMTPMPSANQESLAAGSPDSSHLLGAAGLGLIGGIALAGVLAVFVFNSFVEENDPRIARVTPKVVERLGSEPDAAPQITENAAPPAATVVEEPPREPRTAAVQPEPEPEPPVIEEPSPREKALAAGEKLYAANAIGRGGTPIPLEIGLTDAADEEATLISVKGLPTDAKLSTGIDVGGGQWLLPPSRLAALTVTTPEGLSGGFELEVQLLKDDAQTPLSDPIAFRVRVAGPNEKIEAESAATAVPKDEAALAIASADRAAQIAEVPEETPRIETDVLTQLLIRDGNKLMRNGDILAARRLYEQAAASDNPEAALAMGRSFDPSYFEKLPIKTGKPDPATAFQWYKKALDGGLVTARVKIDGLKQWLQR